MLLGNYPLRWYVAHASYLCRCCQLAVHQQPHQAHRSGDGYDDGSGFWFRYRDPCGCVLDRFPVANLNSMLEQAWSCGGETDTVLTTSSVYSTISAFTSIATRFRDVQSRSQAQIIGAADVYVSAFGSHNIRISRYIPSTYVYAST